jgi:hypothetical protein
MPSAVRVYQRVLKILQLGSMGCCGHGWRPARRNSLRGRFLRFITERGMAIGMKYGIRYLWTNERWRGVCMRDVSRLRDFTVSQPQRLSVVF